MGGLVPADLGVCLQHRAQLLPDCPRHSLAPVLARLQLFGQQQAPSSSGAVRPDLDGLSQHLQRLAVTSSAARRQCSSHRGAQTQTWPAPLWMCRQRTCTMRRAVPSAKASSLVSPAWTCQHPALLCMGSTCVVQRCGRTPLRAGCQGSWCRPQALPARSSCALPAPLQLRVTPAPGTLRCSVRVLVSPATSAAEGRPQRSWQRPG